MTFEEILPELKKGAKSISITMMIVALLVIWGGLIFSLIRLPKEEK